MTELELKRRNRPNQLPHQKVNIANMEVLAPDSHQMDVTV